MEASSRMHQNDVKIENLPASGVKLFNNDSLSKSKSCEEIESIKKQATMLFLQGKRSMFIKDYEEAVVSFGESCLLFRQIYPEDDIALGDPYFYYGKALLEVGRTESEVLGDQVQDGEKDSDDEDDNEDEEEEEEPGKNDAETNDEGNDQQAKNEANSQESSTNNEEKYNDENAEGNETAENIENGEISDLQLSWENLESARIIYLKKADSCKDTALKLAETYVCLGENGLESANYPLAIEEFKHALELQKKYLPEEDRKIAGTFYNLGLAYSLYENYDEAVENFINALTQLRKKKTSLELKSTAEFKNAEEEAKDAAEKKEVVKQINETIQDLEEKIKDMQQQKSLVKEKLREQVFNNQAGESSSTANASQDSSSSETKVATDISHLIRKKRKNDDNSQEANPEKKSKVEN